MGTNKLAFTREANLIFESTLPCSRSERINLKKSPKNKHLTYLYEEWKKKVLYHWPQVDMVPILFDNLRKANYETPTPGITSLKLYWLNISFKNALIFIVVTAILNISSLEFELKFERPKSKFQMETRQTEIAHCWFKQNWKKIFKHFWLLPLHSVNCWLLCKTVNSILNVEYCFILLVHADFCSKFI
jgi:hypothetical protein